MKKTKKKKKKKKINSDAGFHISTYKVTIIKHQTTLYMLRTLKGKNMPPPPIPHQILSFQSRPLLNRRTHFLQLPLKCVSILSNKGQSGQYAGDICLFWSDVLLFVYTD